MKPSIPKNIFLIFLLSVAVIGFVVFLTTQSSIAPGSTTSNSTQKDNSLNTYTSKDLKISFEYPANWYLDEKGRSILLTSYETFIGENKSPSSNQVKVDIDPISLCQPSIEQNLIYGGCGENQKILNKIFSKELNVINSSNHYKFDVEFPDESRKTLRYVEKNNKFVQISKTPDPSQFEKEFEDLVNSIKFLD